MAKKVALINMKGGVGKSTLAAQLAWEMAKRPWSKRVLVVDLDPQFNCTQYLLGSRKTEQLLRSSRPTVWNIFEQLTAVPGKPSAPFEPEKAVTTVGDYPYYIPSKRVLVPGGLVHLIPSQLEVSQVLHNPMNKELLLNQAVEKLEDNYDLVIIDCPPTDSILTKAAYLASDYILIPVRPEFLSTVGLPLLEKSLANFQHLYPNETPSVLGMVFNNPSYASSPEQSTSKNDVRSVARDTGWPIFDAEIPYSQTVPRSAREGKAISATGNAQYPIKSSFSRFAREFAQRVSI